MSDTQMIEELEAEQSMFVQTARGITSDGRTLTLNEVTPSTLYFSDRPKRIVGHMATSDFIDLWAAGENSFEADPPNAVLAFLEPGDDVTEDAVVVIPAPPSAGRPALLLNRDPGGIGSHACWAGDSVHRPVRAAALARVGVRSAASRASADAQTNLTALAHEALSAAIRTESADTG